MNEIAMNTGIKKLDEILEGKLINGALYLIASHPGYGKTTLAAQIAGSIAKSDKRVCFITLEMIEEQLKELMARQGNSDVSLFIDDRSRLTPAEMKEQIIAQHAEIAFIDYLTLISIDGKFENRLQEITEITRQLKVIAKELQIPIICLSQLSRRAMFERGKGHIPRPDFQDLRVFGSIEQDCDVIIFLHKEDATDKTVEIIVAKNRYGICASFETILEPNELVFIEKK